MKTIRVLERVSIWKEYEVTVPDNTETVEDFFKAEREDLVEYSNVEYLYDTEHNLEYDFSNSGLNYDEIEPELQCVLKQECDRKIAQDQYDELKAILQQDKVLDATNNEDCKNLIKETCKGRYCYRFPDMGDGTSIVDIDYKNITVSLHCVSKFELSDCIEYVASGTSFCQTFTYGE